ncbi:GAF domain-containing protein [Bradyrhizobium sp. 44]|uniref:sensor histidine kinase n=1 Tax=unclassified Bradyrhizobium TaxID=2631580 RepID=UPI001FFBD446|nr:MULTISPECIES: histidine kinase dimerization/phosphoacceptor domain -containing protein [unclassified Bradyrhizobium]MCK1283887.1 GAF domain-containing protein [Bradyrhizobium sp. 44]MCK1368032.1 GAF domain-containing protein [Bradyrhizobium sp. 62]
MENPSDPAESELLDKLRHHIRILVEIGRLSARADLSRFLDQVVVQVARAVEISHVKVLCYRPREADLLALAGTGWKDGLVGSATFSVDLRSPPGRAFQTAEPVTIKNVAEQEEYDYSECLKEHGIVSLTNVPILIEGAAWGVLEVDSTTLRDFSEDTTDFLIAAAAMISAAVRHHNAEPDERERLIAAAAEAQSREILLREMQHRVKNNFQLVIAAISNQKRRRPAEDVHQALDYVASRISAIAIAHDQLAPRQDGRIVKLSDYIRALCGAIRQQADGVDVDVQCDELELSIDRALPVGLVLNEIAMNSIKHAFGPSGGRISVSLVGGIGYGEARLTVADNGRGIRDINEHGSGLKLINSLAKQIGGLVEQASSDSGTVTSLRFPLIT